MRRKKKGGCFFRWMKSDLPDREENPAPVLLLAVHKNSPNVQRDKPASSDCFALPCPKQYDEQTLPVDRHKHFISQLNDRFRKTLSLDSRTDQNGLRHTARPKSMVNATNFTLNSCSSNLPNTSKTSDSRTFKKKRFRPKSFFSLETFLDSRRSEGSVDDFSSSKYCKFYLDSSTECSPVLKGRTTPDLLDVPAITDASSHFYEESRCKKRLDKLENHFNKLQKLKHSQRSTIDSSITKRDYNPEEPLYAEPLYDGSVASQTTLVIDSKTEIENTLIPKVQFYQEIADTSKPSTNTSYNINRETTLNSSIKKTYNCQETRIAPQEASVPHWGGFGDCSSILRDVCNTDCSNSIIKSKGICCKEGTPSSAYEIHISEDDVLINEKTKNLVVKTMDKSVDSIGSCSLDVDAENTDFSDTTSGSLNILTPSSTTSHYRDFTSKLHERATPGLHQNLRSLPLKEENINTTYTYEDPSSTYVPQLKKPSYLHLACSVNGYSNLTTYDSTLRQKLNKSREHSPARLGNLSSFVMLRNYPEDTMAQRLNSTTSNSGTTCFKTSFSETSISSQNVVTYLKSNGQNTTSETLTSKSYNSISNGVVPESPSKSFIQQRVERLYGPAAFAQGFLNQKKHKHRDSGNGVSNNNSEYSFSRTEHSIVKKSPNGVISENVCTISTDQEDCDSVLPVLRHLRPEFRAQLPIPSPKRSPHPKITDNNSHSGISVDMNDLETSFSRLSGNDVVDRSVTNGSGHSVVICKGEEKKPVVTIIPIVNSDCSNKISSNGDAIPKTGVYSNIVHKIENGKLPDPKETNHDESYENIPVIKKSNVDDSTDIRIKIDADNIISKGDVPLAEPKEDGQYFLALNHVEIERLEQLARSAEKDLEEVQNSNDVSEEVKGFLRVAAGKARLLANEKMKQFEGLCFKNINDSPDSKFHTTIEDLQGFWDMVYLQVEDIRVLFQQIDVMKKSNWTELPPVKKPIDAPSKLSSNRTNIATSKKTVKNPVEGTSSKSSAMAKKRDEQRKALIEAKRRAAKAQQNTSVEIFAHPPPSSQADS